MPLYPAEEPSGSPRIAQISKRVLYMCGVAAVIAAVVGVSPDGQINAFVQRCTDVTAFISGAAAIIAFVVHDLTRPINTRIGQARLAEQPALPAAPMRPAAPVTDES